MYLKFNKSLILIAIFISIVLNVIGQKKNSSQMEMMHINKEDSMEVGEFIPFEFDEKNKVIRSFFETGELQEIYQYRWKFGLKIGLEQKNGFYKKFGKNGIIETNGHYVKDKKNGEWLHFNNEGILIRREIWNKGKMVSKVILEYS